MLTSCSVQRHFWSYLNTNVAQIFQVRERGSTAPQTPHTYILYNLHAISRCLATRTYSSGGIKTNRTEQERVTFFLFIWPNPSIYRFINSPNYLVETKNNLTIFTISWIRALYIHHHLHSTIVTSKSQTNIDRDQYIWKGSQENGETGNPGKSALKKP